MRKRLLLFIGIVLVHFVFTYSLLIFGIYEQAATVRGEELNLGAAGNLAANVAKVLSQPLISIKAVHPEPTSALQTFSFMFGNAVIWALIIIGFWCASRKALNKSNQQGPSAGTR